MRHTETRIYRTSLELVVLCRAVLEALPPGYAFLADQLRRASASVLLNFAEGCGKSTRRDRRKFFTIAKGSAYEISRRRLERAGSASVTALRRCSVATTDRNRRLSCV